MNNTLAHSLVARAAAAQKRLALLEGRVDVGSKPSAEMMKAALRELGEVLDALRVATEQLHAASDDLMAARRDAVAHAERYRELHEGLPVPCILTDPEACVDEANGHAAALLNVARPYLTGKPLLLFMPERDQYFRMLERIRVDGSTTDRATLRPRDRKPRTVSIGVTALANQARWCWVFSEVS
ncbi:MAG TPA: PAS domain-containing protein [Vicinamibacterales bacterium]|jgi:PAS domain-containing protein